MNWICYANDIRALVVGDGISIIVVSVPEADIKELLNALVWASDIISKKQIVMEEDVQDNLNLFLSTRDIRCHPSPQDMRLLGSYFAQILPTILGERESNMCTKYIANKGTIVDMKVIW